MLMVLGGLSAPSVSVAAVPETGSKKVYVLPIREDIMPPLTYLVRRGVKEAMEAKADVLVIDMETNGGRVDVTEEIIGIIGKFPGQTVTFVNKKAFSAGAFISFATKKIYMAPQSVIGAAAPVMASPTGGAQEIGGTMELKASSAISALVRANAEKNGHNPAVADAMVKKTSELKLDNQVINEKGQILTLTDQEAARNYGTPARPLLSAGTVENLEALLKQLELSAAQVKRVEPSGVERLGTWINTIAPILLIIGIAGIYIEFKTPGFGLPGIVGVTAFAIYFFGGYIAGLTGLEWVAVFIVGLALLALELFFFPGTLVLGLSGFSLIFLSLVMALVDRYPGAPTLPTLPQLQLPLNQLALAGIGSIVAILLLSRWLPKTALYPAADVTAAPIATQSAGPRRDRFNCGHPTAQPLAAKNRPLPRACFPGCQRRTNATDDCRPATKAAWPDRRHRVPAAPGRQGAVRR